MLDIALGVALGVVTFIVAGVLLSGLIGFVEAAVARFDAMTAHAAARRQADEHLWTDEAASVLYSAGASPIRSR